jgi:hypothetical protein
MPTTTFFADCPCCPDGVRCPGYEDCELPFVLNAEFSISLPETNDCLVGGCALIWDPDLGGWEGEYDSDCGKITVSFFCGTLSAFVGNIVLEGGACYAAGGPYAGTILQNCDHPDGFLWQAGVGLWDSNFVTPTPCPCCPASATWKVTF